MIDEILKLRQWVQIGHHIPGRIRLKYSHGILSALAQFKSDEVIATLEKVKAFKSHKLNLATGSLLIEYDAQLIEPKLLDALFSDSEAEARDACDQLSNFF